MTKKFVEYILPEDTGHFSFIVPEGIYYLVAFEDLNNNFTHDNGEMTGYFGKPDGIVALLGKKTEGWVTGLRLVALSLQHREDLSRFAGRTFSSSVSEMVVRYCNWMATGTVYE
jgi:hypothetical protein